MSENKQDTTVKEKETSKKGFPWAYVIGAILVLAAIFGLWKMVKWQDASMQAAYKAAYQEAYQEALDDNSEEVATSGTIGSDADGSYFPEFSCSHLPSCQISEVPEGYFTIGYKDNGNGCDWMLYEAGETIDYSEIDEFHTYNQLLPLTKLEGFVAAQFQYVLACTINN